MTTPDPTDAEKHAAILIELAANPAHSQFWHQPWSEMADLCRAVDALDARRG